MRHATGCAEFKPVAARRSAVFVFVLFLFLFAAAGVLRRLLLRGLGGLGGLLLGRALRFRLLPCALLTLRVHRAALLLGLLFRGFLRGVLLLGGLLPGVFLRGALLLHLLLPALFEGLLFRGLLGGALLLHLLLARPLGGLLPGGVLRCALGFHLLLAGAFSRLLFGCFLRGPLLIQLLFAGAVGGLLFGRFLRGALLIHLQFPALLDDLLLLLALTFHRLGFHLLTLHIGLFRRFGLPLSVGLALGFELFLLGCRRRCVGFALAGHALLIGLQFFALRLRGALLLLRLHLFFPGVRGVGIRGLLLPHRGGAGIGLTLAGETLLFAFDLLNFRLRRAQFLRIHFLLLRIRLLARGRLLFAERVGVRIGLADAPSAPARP